ncbi:MAG: hypothetical protein E6K76_04805 [Candidatus Eisenbacteria bacterium]|uniref:Uncharacterized protein n=1 Tax=Eiseniibacteriota bacterium TaxID=2212470 RepID=A0A538T6W3_UNCEI|nr:MAG: hypothetical protein E6K76_04805 [Candidatus Eisenbacteria bacterium]
MLFDAVRDVSVSLSTLVAAGLAFVGLNAWRRQLRGTTEYQIALKTLKAIYALRESITEARRRFGVVPYPGQRPSGDRGHVSEVLRAAQSYRRRLTAVGTCRADLLLAEQEALAVWGDRARDALAKLLLAVDELLATYDQYFDAELARARRKDHEGKEEEPSANDIVMYRILYSNPEENKDPFGKRIARSSGLAEAFYRDRLK